MLWSPPLPSGPGSPFCGFSAARQRVSPLPPLPGDLGAASQDRAAQITPAARRLGGALGSRPRPHPATALRPRHPRGSPWPPAPCTHAHTPPPRTPASRRQADPRTAGGTHRPNPQPRRWHKPSHPTPSPLPQAPASANARRAPAASLPHSPTFCSSPSLRLSALAPPRFLNPAASSAPPAPQF